MTAVPGQWESHLKLVLEQLNEKHRRWVAGLLSETLGHGGTKRIAEAGGIDLKTILRGYKELQQGLVTCVSGRVRRPGAGRPALKKRLGD